MDNRWSWAKFAIGKTGNKFVAWAVYMVFQYMALYIGHISVENQQTLIIVSAIVTIIFMLAGAIDVAVENAKITADFKTSLLKGGSNDK